MNPGMEKDLLEILECPRCQGEFTLTPEEDGLICMACKLKYPIRDDVPAILTEEAEPVD